jgi:hypothetical protein
MVTSGIKWDFQSALWVVDSLRLESKKGRAVSGRRPGLKLFTNRPGRPGKQKEEAKKMMMKMDFKTEVERTMTEKKIGRSAAVQNVMKTGYDRNRSSGPPPIGATDFMAEVERTMAEKKIGRGAATRIVIAGQPKLHQAWLESLKSGKAVK